MLMQPEIADCALGGDCSREARGNDILHDNGRTIAGRVCWGFLCVCLVVVRTFLWSLLSLLDAKVVKPDPKG